MELKQYLMGFRVYKSSDLRSGKLQEKFLEPFTITNTFEYGKIEIKTEKTKNEKSVT